ncbi:Cas10/Cmr2 second palm domain-containing protein [Leptothoe spongobia]|nr:type III-B CRISPR-associated protein Cas10/Cmr2 [Leptothoe spongobia]
MTDCYTAITFAPVQGFIEKSRKLRDLYGSSFILSYLATQICNNARSYFNYPDTVTWPDDPVISPANINVAQGTPNLIFIRGNFPQDNAYRAMQTAWKDLLRYCRQWIETAVSKTPKDKAWQYTWERPWREWENHTWEFFWATGSSIEAARRQMNQVKYARAWTGINYVGESSTLSGQDSRAWPQLGHHASHNRSSTEEDSEVRDFYQQLSQAIDKQGATITIREQLSIPELVKRLVTIEKVMDRFDEIPNAETPQSFKKNRRWTDTPASAEDMERDTLWTGWFQGDGDQVGKYLNQQSQQAKTSHEKENSYHEFSERLRNWGYDLDEYLPSPEAISQTSDTLKLRKDGRIVYAGGDDFLGTLYRNMPSNPLKAKECLNWFYTFKPDIWSRHGQDISVSVGFVWASPQVPQRDILQHCRLAEKSAKTSGRDRIALRILFSDGKHLEWHCPWRFLTILEDYRDRNRKSETQNWTHLYNDVATLDSRHTFVESESDIAHGLLKIYFPVQLDQLPDTEIDKKDFYTLIQADSLDVNSDVLWNIYSGGKNRYDNQGIRQSTGILGDHSDYEMTTGEPDLPKVHDAFNTWVINLAKIGFHLCDNK